MTTSGEPDLVDRHQPLAQHAQRAAQLGADLLEVPRSLSSAAVALFQLGLLFGQFGLDRGLALAQRRDFADHRVDRRVLFGDRRRERALAGPHVGELALRALQLGLEVLGRGAGVGDGQRADAASSNAASNRDPRRVALGCVSEKKARIDPRPGPSL